MFLHRNFEVKEGIYVFDSGMDPARSAYDARLLQDQERQEESHFWFQMRRDKICSLFQQHFEKEAKVLEIGGGTGFIAQQIKALGYSIAMGDIHFNGLKYAHEKGIEPLYQFDLFNPPFQEEFDGICLFDVLEHQKEDAKAIECIKKMLKSKGKIMLTVPAHQWLWSRDDRINGHYRRYTKKSLLELCRRCDLKPLHIEYFFTFIVPLLFLRRLLNRDRIEDASGAEKLILKLPLGLNGFCHGFTQLEFALSRWLPNKVGGSLCLIAERRYA